jgi:NhaP-type Na+/H+ or K+/H+ antiporter
MSPLVALGSIGVGLVWGWLLGSLTGRIHRPWTTGVSAALATGVVATCAALLAGPRPLALLLGAVALAALLHAGWRGELARQAARRSRPLF